MLLQYQIIYVTLGVLTFLSFLWAGIKYTRYDNYNFRRNYWKIAILPIIMFSVFYGLRFGRLVDYNVYAENYSEIGKNILYNNYEFLFRNVVHYMYNFDIPYWIFILLCSVIYVVSLFCYFKHEDNKDSMLFILFLGFFCSGGIEQLVRWYLAFSFFLFSLYFIRKENYFCFTCFSASAFLFHMGFLLLVPVSFLFLVNRSLISNKLSICMLIFSVFLGNTQYLTQFVQYISFLSINEKATNWVEIIGSVLNGDFHEGIRVASFYRQLMWVVMFSFPILLGDKLIEAGLLKHGILNIYKIAVVVYPIFTQVEILDRYSQVLILISVPVVCGKAFMFLYRNTHLFNTVEFILGCLSLLSFLYTFFWNKLLEREEWYMLLFIWDADGRESLPVYHFVNF